MAVSTDPLNRSSVAVTAQLPGTRLEAPRTNAALQLAESLAALAPEARQAMANLAEKKAEKVRAQAIQDAYKNAGQKLADAVREGKIKPTQNPWYVQSYNRTASALSAERRLAKLQADSGLWEEGTDPEKFAQRWRTELGQIASEYSDKDQFAGFQSVEARFSAQVLQQNAARNSARIISENRANLSALAASALRDAWRGNGGKINPNLAYTSIEPVKLQWFATGGDQEGWEAIVEGAITAASLDPDNGSGREAMLDLMRAPEVLYGPSDQGDLWLGDNQGFTGPTTSIVEVNPDAPPGSAPRVKVSAPASKLRPPIAGDFPVTSGFGARKRPTKGASTNHKGLDIATPQGTPVQAQATGKVIFAGRKGGLGNAVQVDYGGGVVATFGHLSEITVKEGQVVAPGQAVAKTGSTGVSTGPHLHYGLEVNGKATDPSKFAGKVGGEFEADQEAPAVNTPAFPGEDQPYQAGSTGRPAHLFAAGPTLFDRPEVAARVESTRYRVQSAVEAAAQARYRAMDNRRKDRGYELADRFYAEFGYGVTTGEVTSAKLREKAASWGFSIQEFNAAMSFVKNDVSDVVQFDNARVAARAQDPGVAQEILKTTAKAAQEGWSPGLQADVEKRVATGELSLSEAQSLIGTAFSTTERITSRNRAEAKDDERQAQAEKANKDLNRMANVARVAREQAALLVKTMQRAGTLPPQYRDQNVGVNYYTEFLTNAMLAWLAEHPGDDDGALRAAVMTGTNIAQNNALRAKQRAEARSAAANSAGD